MKKYLTNIRVNDSFDAQERWQFSFQDSNINIRDSTPALYNAIRFFVPIINVFICFFLIFRFILGIEIFVISSKNKKSIENKSTMGAAGGDGDGDPNSRYKLLYKRYKKINREYPGVSVVVRILIFSSAAYAAYTFWKVIHQYGGLPPLDGLLRRELGNFKFLFQIWQILGDFEQLHAVGIQAVPSTITVADSEKFLTGWHEVAEAAWSRGDYAQLKGILRDLTWILKKYRQAQQIVPLP